MKGEARGAMAGKPGDAAAVPGAGGKNPFQCVLDKENTPDGTFAERQYNMAAKAAPLTSGCLMYFVLLPLSHHATPWFWDGSSPPFQPAPS